MRGNCIPHLSLTKLQTKPAWLALFEIETSNALQPQGQTDASRSQFGFSILTCLSCAKEYMKSRRASSIWTSNLESGRFEAVLLELLIEGVREDSGPAMADSQSNSAWVGYRGATANAATIRYRCAGECFRSLPANALAERDFRSGCSGSESDPVD